MNRSGVLGAVAVVLGLVAGVVTGVSSAGAYPTTDPGPSIGKPWGPDPGQMLVDSTPADSQTAGAFEYEAGNGPDSAIDAYDVSYPGLNVVWEAWVKLEADNTCAFSPRDATADAQSCVIWSGYDDPTGHLSGMGFAHAGGTEFNIFTFNRPQHFAEGMSHAVVGLPIARALKWNLVTLSYQTGCGCYHTWFNGQYVNGLSGGLNHNGPFSLGGMRDQFGNRHKFQGEVKHHRKYHGTPNQTTEIDVRAQCFATAAANESDVSPDDPNCQGAASLDPSAFAPHLSCGRTMRDMGNGQWFADVEAIVRNPDPDATDTGHWKVSWSDETYPGATVTIPLPAGASTEENLWVSYWNERTTTQVIGWSQAQESGAEWVDNPDLHAGTPFAYTLPGAWLLQGILGGDGEPEDTGGGWVSFDVDGDGVVGDVIPAQPLTTVKKATAVCTVRVSPVTMHSDPDVIIINMPDHPADTGGGSSGPTPPPPGSVDGAGACGGGSWWNPITWAKSIFCGLVDILSWLRDVVWTALQNFDLPFDLPGLKVEWSEKFPLSVGAEAVDAFEGLNTALQSGMGDSCGPTFSPDLSGMPNMDPATDTGALRVSLPSPNAGCEQSEFAAEAADLGGFRAPLRSFFVVLMWAGFFVKVAHSIGPGRSGIEPTSDGEGGR